MFVKDKVDQKVQHYCTVQFVLQTNSSPIVIDDALNFRACRVRLICSCLRVNWEVVLRLQQYEKSGSFSSGRKNSTDGKRQALNMTFSSNIESLQANFEFTFAFLSTLEASNVTIKGGMVNDKFKTFKFFWICFPYFVIKHFDGKIL